MFRTIKAEDGRVYRPFSRWCKVDCVSITSRHRLFDYSDNGELLCFRSHGVLYAVGQFLSLTYPIMWEDAEGKLQHLSGYDSTNYYNPLLVEIECGGEYVRLWEEVKED